MLLFLSYDISDSKGFCMTNEVEMLVRPTQRNLECNEQEKSFCNYILAGKSQVDSCILAGYYSDEDPNDPVVRNRIRVKAKNLLKKKSIVHYLAVNKKKIYLTDDCDVPALKHHLYEIAMGRAKGKYIDANGDEHETEPSFKEQVSASLAFMKFNDSDRKYKLLGVQTMSDAQAMVQESKVSSILAKYRSVDIVTTNFYDKHPEIEAEYEEDVANGIVSSVDYNEAGLGDSDGD